VLIFCGKCFQKATSGFTVLYISNVRLVLYFAASMLLEMDKLKLVTR